MQTVNLQPTLELTGTPTFGFSELLDGEITTTKNKNMNYKYWMVHNPNNSKPTVRHDDVKTAFDEAERLAAANPGQTFNVLESTYSFTTEKPRVVRESIEAAPKAAPTEAA